MAREINGSKVVSYIGKLAFGKANDAVKLAFLDADNLAAVDDFDLSMVSEIKRGANGVVEVKLINRIALLELLSKLVSPQEEACENGKAESFFSSLDRAAERIGEVGD